MEKARSYLKILTRKSTGMRCLGMLGRGFKNSSMDNKYKVVKKRKWILSIQGRSYC